MPRQNTATKLNAILAELTYVRESVDNLRDEFARVTDSVQRELDAHTERINGLHLRLFQLEARIVRLEGATGIDEPEDSSDRLAQLIANIATYFSLAELKEFALALGLNPDKYQNMQDAPRELVLYCFRHGQLDDFVSEATKLRPHLDWT